MRRSRLVLAFVVMFAMFGGFVRPTSDAIAAEPYQCGDSTSLPAGPQTTPPLLYEGLRVGAVGETIQTSHDSLFDGLLVTITSTVTATLKGGPDKLHNPIVIVCVEVGNVSSGQDVTIPSNAFVLRAVEENTFVVATSYPTAFINGLTVSRSMAMDSPEFTIQVGETRDFPIAFATGDSFSATPLLVGLDQSSPNGLGDEIWALQTAIDWNTEPIAMQVTPPIGGQEEVGTTSFGEPVLAHVGFNKWNLTFDPAVEVRYFIGDQSVTPTRGQFLVIWFDQSSQQGEPLKLGNFDLEASAGVGEPSVTYPLAEMGTAALIVTEYNWHPDFMEVGTDYRTGIAFDIKPEDTHFRLTYKVHGNDPWGGYRC